MSDLGNKKTMARNIQRLMKMKGKSRLEVCTDLGFKYSTFTSWYNGDIYPRIDKIEKMADYFGVSKADLIEDFTKSEPIDLQRKSENGEFKIYDFAKEPQEARLIDVYRQLNPEGQDKVLTFALKLRDDPNYQSDDLVREMFNRYIKAGLITNLSGGDDEDVDGTNKKRKDQV